MNNTIYDVMKDRGWKDVSTTGQYETDWDFHWADVFWVHEVFDTIHLLDHQRINHFRNHYELTRKDFLVKNVKRMVRYIEREYGRQEDFRFEFISTSFVLPQEHAMFQEEFKRNPGSLWIMKPGKGIFLINKLNQISQWRKDPKTNSANERIEPEAYIVQKYIDNPYLIGGRKFDLRIYVLVTSYSPLTVYIHRNGFCRFSNSTYSSDAKDLSNLYIHATNVAVQKTAPNYDGERGCKWLLRNLKMFIMTKHGEQECKSLFGKIEAMIIRSLLCVQKVMIQDKHCFELYGYDVLIDNTLNPWLLEVNASP
ncbi:tubulin-tyrosine ligase [Rozella allomycis CSF55]|uniref:Tubulin--tyrosine ligase-like protein 9 n=1 Tax=Rozella allomycis (strain CSF55) TaxID=988480 RepID=A0A4P9YQC8_ROZAC|nr:tubulin-tyrosine ligase [Rozella allomycis CSF55]